MFTLLVVVCALLGLVIGSFLNVVIYRVPLGQSIVTPPSACPGCARPIAPRDNIPVLSWLVLRGRCRWCHVPISARYPLVEGLTSALFALTAARLGASWSLPAELAFVASLIALGAIDLERHLLPRTIVYPSLGLVMAGLVLAAAVTQHWERLGVAVLCGTASFAVFFAVNWIRPGWLGFGDVRLAALIGLALGWLGPWYLLIGFMAANAIGAAVGIGLILAGRATRKTQVPYGVFLGAGSILAVLVGGPVIAWYSHNLLR